MLNEQDLMKGRIMGNNKISTIVSMIEFQCNNYKFGSRHVKGLSLIKKSCLIKFEDRIVNKIKKSNHKLKLYYMQYTLPWFIHVSTLVVSVHPSKGLFTNRSVNTIQLLYLPRITKFLAISILMPLEM